MVKLGSESASESETESVSKSGVEGGVESESDSESSICGGGGGWISAMLTVSNVSELLEDEIVGQLIGKSSKGLRFSGKAYFCVTLQGC